MGATLKYMKNVEIAIIAQWALVGKALPLANISFEMLIENNSINRNQLS
jgi:hypothetical protein